MSGPCCGVSPTILKGDGKIYCLECDSEQKSTHNEIDFSKLYGEIDDWKMTSSPAKVKECECGSESVGSDKHSYYCPLYEK